MPKPKLTPTQRRLKSALTDAATALSSAEQILWPLRSNGTLDIEAGKIAELRRELEHKAATVHEWR